MIKINESEFVHAKNFIEILKDILPNLKLSLTQWNMIAKIAQIERSDDLININDFLCLDFFFYFISSIMTSYTSISLTSKVLLPPVNS